MHVSGYAVVERRVIPWEDDGRIPVAAATRVQGMVSTAQENTGTSTCVRLDRS